MLCFYGDGKRLLWHPLFIDIQKGVMAVWYGTDCQMTKQRRRRVEKKEKLSYDTLVSV